MTVDLKSSELVFYRSTQLENLYSEVCSDYLEYLADARNAIRDCQIRCVCWCAPYDGQTQPVPCPEDFVAMVTRARSASNSSGSVANGNIPNQRRVLTSLDDTHIPQKRSKSANEDEQKPRVPDLGLFITTLFQKVERMPQNSFYVNLILTGVVSRLALYPQPLLRSFLLNYNMVLKPGVRSLFQVWISFVWSQSVGNCSISMESNCGSCVYGIDGYQVTIYFFRIFFYPFYFPLLSIEVLLFFVMHGQCDT